MLHTVPLLFFSGWDTSTFWFLARLTLFFRGGAISLSNIFFGFTAAGLRTKSVLVSGL